MKLIKTTLAALPVGQSGTVISVGGEGALRIRLLDMGIIPKTRITVVKVAPMGDPIELYLRGYSLTLRRKDASLIDVMTDIKFESEGANVK